MTTVEDALLKLSVGDRAFCEGIAGVHVGVSDGQIDSGTVALMRLSALVAIGPAEALLHEAVGDALDAGLSCDAIVGSMIAVAPTIGINHLVAAAPALAVALGYDLETSFESLDSKNAISGGTS